MQAADEDPVPDEHRILLGRAFVVERQVPRKPAAAPLSPTFNTGFPKRRPSVIISRACGFSYTKSASDR